MFAGLIEEMGVVKTIDRRPTGVRVTILASRVLGDLDVGASVSVNGVCLTAVEVQAGQFSVEVSPETLAVTSLGQAKVGVPVNLERAMKLNERLGGHLVSGHVDAVGFVRGRRQDGNGILLTIDAPHEVLRYCVHKGSVTLDGVSMTINRVDERSISVMVIPHTATETTLGLKQEGDAVNLEADVIGKYVERLLEDRGVLPSRPAAVIDADYLKKRGLI